MKPKFKNTDGYLIAGGVLIFSAIVLSHNKPSASGAGFFDTTSEDGVSPHFSWDEVTHTAHNIANVLPDQYRQNARYLAQEILEPIRAFTGRAIIVNSWFRSPELNSAVGGSPTSDHLQAKAADIEDSGGNNKLLIRAALQWGLPFDQMIIYDDLDNPTRVHFSYEYGSRKQEIKFKRNGQYSTLNKQDALNYYL